MYSLDLVMFQRPAAVKSNNSFRLIPIELECCAFSEFISDVIIVWNTDIVMDCFFESLSRVCVFTLKVSHLSSDEAQGTSNSSLEYIDFPCMWIVLPLHTENNSGRGLCDGIRFRPIFVVMRKIFTIYGSLDRQSNKTNDFKRATTSHSDPLSTCLCLMKNRSPWSS